MTSNSQISRDDDDSSDNITNDDLQAMKDMIGAMKKDPSLLYKLSSLPEAEGPGGSNNNTNNTNLGAAMHSMNMSMNNLQATPSKTSRSINVYSDDITEVSSLGMYSSTNATKEDPYAAATQFATLSGASPSNHNDNTNNNLYSYTNNKANNSTLTPTNNNNNNNNNSDTNSQQSPNMSIQIKHTGPYSNATSFAQATAEAIKNKRAHDAEIALRMQSLRAAKAMNASVNANANSPKPSASANANSPKPIVTLTTTKRSSSSVPTRPTIVSPVMLLPPPHSVNKDEPNDDDDNNNNESFELVGGLSNDDDVGIGIGYANNASDFALDGEGRSSVVNSDDESRSSEEKVSLSDNTDALFSSSSVHHHHNSHHHPDAEESATSIIEHEHETWDRRGTSDNDAKNHADEILNNFDNSLGDRAIAADTSIDIEEVEDETTYNNTRGSNFNDNTFGDDHAERRRNFDNSFGDGYNTYENRHAERKSSLDNKLNVPRKSSSSRTPPKDRNSSSSSSSKKTKGRRRSSVDNSSHGHSSSHHNRRQDKEITATNDDETDSAALVLYSDVSDSAASQQQRQNIQQQDQYNHNEGILTIPPSQAVVSHGGEGQGQQLGVYTNYQFEPPTAAANYYSGVSKYAVVVDNKNERSGSNKRSPSRTAASNKSSSNTSSGKRHGRDKHSLQHSIKSTTRSRSELPHHREDKDHRGDNRVSSRTKGERKKKKRSVSEQPNHHKKSHHHRHHQGKKESRRHTHHDNHNDDYDDNEHSPPPPPPPPTSSENNISNSAPAPLSRKMLMRSLRAEQQSQRTIDPDQVERRMLELGPSSNDDNMSSYSNNNGMRARSATDGDDVVMSSNSTIRGERADTVSFLPNDHHTNKNGVGNTSFEQQQKQDGDIHPESPAADTSQNGWAPPLTSTVSRMKLTSDSSSIPTPTQSNDLNNLSLLDALDGGNKSHRPSVASESGRSVISRLSSGLRRPRISTTRSVSSNDITGSRSVGGTSLNDYMWHHRSENNNDTSPLKSRRSMGSSVDEAAAPRRRSRSSMVSRISKFGSSGGGSGSPKTSLKRQTSIEVSDHEDAEQMIIDPISQSDRPYIENDKSDSNNPQGIDLAMDSGVPRICDDRGRCLYHPHLRLQKPKLLGGWKVLYQHCPDCAVEHMKKTQEKLAMIQKQKADEQKKRKLEKKKKKRREKHEKSSNDPILGMDVSEHDITTSDGNTKKKRSHKSKKKKERERIKKELAVSREALASDPAYDINEGDDNIINDEPHYDDRQEESDMQQYQQQEEPEDQYQQHIQEQPPQQYDEPEEMAKVTPEEQPADDVTVALDPHQPQPKSMQKKVNGLPWSDYNGHSGRYTGEVNEQYLPHGQGEMVYDRGMKSTGLWYNGVLDTEDTTGGLGLMTVDDVKQPQKREEYTPDILPHYSVGDKGNDEDMIIENKKTTAAAVSKIRPNDAAFVRRSNGSWTYAVVKDRTYSDNETIRFKVNVRGSTKAFPTSQWGTYVRRVKKVSNPAPSPASMSLSSFLDNTKAVRRTAQSVAGNMRHSSDVTVNSTHSAPVAHRSVHNLTNAKMKIRTRSRSRSRNRKNITTLPLLFSSSMSVSEENEGNDSDNWETASGSGYRLRGIDP